MCAAPTRTPPAPEDLVRVDDFFDRVVRAYEQGIADQELEADVPCARSIIPAATGTVRDFSHIAPEIPEFIAERCVACMDCVTECPDAAIRAKAIPRSQLDDILARHDEAERTLLERCWAETRKFTEQAARRGLEPARFAIFIDPTKCKGCGECVEVCDDNALRMVDKTDTVLENARRLWQHCLEVGPTPRPYITEKILSDMLLAEQAWTYVGGATSCAGCGEATALRMMAAATGFVYGPESFGVLAATGCNTVFCSTYPYNPWRVPWSNSLFENVATYAMGVRARWDQKGWNHRKIWCVGGDGALFDIGLQALSRMLASGMDINVLVLDTQVYSNTGGQASTATFTGQETKMSAFGRAIGGKQERRKELWSIVLAHDHVFFAQTTPAHVNHFYKAILRANEFPGPSVVVTYSACLPEHGIGDHLAAHQARLAVDSRAFPLILYDPDKGPTLRERLSLRGNPAPDQDWYTDPRTGQVIDFIAFARSEARFAKHFDENGNPSDTLRRANQDRLENWRRLQELAGLRKPEG